MGVNWGLPYQGSKGKFAPMIFRAISQRASNRDSHIYDLFCGGAAVSHYFLFKGWGVSASDIDHYQVALLRQILFSGGLPEWEKRWVSRELFKHCRDAPEATGLSEAEVQLVRLVWSFGNSGTSYLYGSHQEETKELIHNLVALGRPSERLEELVKVPIKAQQQVSNLSEEKRRAGWRRVGQKIGLPSRLIQIDHLSRIERLKNLQLDSPAGESGPHASVSLEGYAQVLDGLQDGDIVYLDPPYAGTTGYAGAGTFDHSLFWEKAEDAAIRGVQVYVSEYTAPEHWRSILSFNRPNTMAADSYAKSNGVHREHLFTLKGAV